MESLCKLTPLTEDQSCDLGYQQVYGDIRVGDICVT